MKVFLLFIEPEHLYSMLFKRFVKGGKSWSLELKENKLRGQNLQNNIEVRKSCYSAVMFATPPGNYFSHSKITFLPYLGRPIFLKSLEKTTLR